MTDNPWKDFKAGPTVRYHVNPDGSLRPLTPDEERAPPKILGAATIISITPSATDAEFSE